MKTTTITRTSREFTARERIAIKDTKNAESLDQVITEDKPIVIIPQDFILMHIDNDETDGNGYDTLVILDKAGVKYYTGSSSFQRAFFDIWDEMCQENEEYKIECYKLPSRNYKGKFYLGCSIL